MPARSAHGSPSRGVAWQSSVMAGGARGERRGRAAGGVEGGDSSGAAAAAAAAGAAAAAAAVKGGGSSSKGRSDASKPRARRGSVREVEDTGSHRPSDRSGACARTRAPQCGGHGTARAAAPPPLFRPQVAAGGHTPVAGFHFHTRRLGTAARGACVPPSRRAPRCDPDPARTRQAGATSPSPKPRKGGPAVARCARWRWRTRQVPHRSPVAALRPRNIARSTDQLASQHSRTPWPRTLPTLATLFRFDDRRAVSPPPLSLMRGCLPRCLLACRAPPASARRQCPPWPRSPAAKQSLACAGARCGKLNERAARAGDACYNKVPLRCQTNKMSRDTSHFALRGCLSRALRRAPRALARKRTPEPLRSCV